MTTIEPHPGQHIATVADLACRRAESTGQPVAFSFNGVPVTVAPGESPDTVHARWSAEMDRRGEEYRNSPEGREAAQKGGGEVIRRQGAVDRLVARLPNVARDEPALMRWVAAFVPEADDIDVKWDKRAVAATLTAAGWVAGDCVGMEPEVIEGSPNLMARYVVGQALDGWGRGQAVHPMVGKFAGDYLAMRGRKGEKGKDGSSRPV